MRIRTACWIAVSICVRLLIAPSLSEAATITVPAGSNLQTALNLAQAGDVIMLAPGATYVGNFILPNKGVLSDYITIRSAAPDAMLPAPGVRMTPSYAAQLPKIRSSNNMSALRTAAAANHWKLLFLEFQANVKGYGDIIALGAGGSTQTMLSQVPYAIVIDRVYVHGDPVTGQKRGIALHSSDTTVINSYVSECKTIGDESQAISGFNGPGNYVIENNYLEGATENFLLGGSDPTIPNLVTTKVTFRFNHLRKPLTWRDAIVATPASVSAGVVPGGGSLEAGSYSYKVVARMSAGQTNKASSSPSVEASATIAAGMTGGVTVSWTPVAGADEYFVYGRAAGLENMYWKTTTPYVTDTGAAGTSGTPGGSGTKWAVKNIFELKNAQDVLIEGNVFENIWVADQVGYAIVFTPRNQSQTAPWAVVQRVTFQNNLVRHAAGGMNILGIDNLAPSQRANHITVRSNVFDDLSSATWGSGSKVFQVGDGPDSVTFDHNTIVTTDSTILALYGGSVSAPTAVTNAAFTNNMSVHNSYGIFGSGFASGTSSINAYMPGAVVSRNVLAGGTASKYPTGNFFPTAAAWQGNFASYAAGDFHLTMSSVYRNAATDGTDLGADIDTIDAQTANALSGDNSLAPGVSHVRIITSELPNGMMNQAYAQSIVCTGGVGPCAWQVRDASLPAGVTFDAVAAVVSGTPSQVQTGAITLDAYDPAWPANIASVTLSLTIDAPLLVVSIPAAPTGQVGVAYELAPVVSGAVGSASWSVVSGDLPAGVTLNNSSGSIAGVPFAWGSFTAMVQAQDSWGANRIDAKPVTILVAPTALAISPTTQVDGTYGLVYTSSLAATGGTGPTTWMLSGGALPAGLTLGAGGIIDGTPTVAGTFSFTVQAADAGWPGNIATQAFRIAVGRRDVVLYASDATTVAGTWSLVPDATAAGGSRLWNPDLAAPKIGVALANPVNYFEIAFQAEAGMAYHMWIRGKADKNAWANDSIYVQFSGTVDAVGAPLNRIGTTSAAALSIEDGTSAGLAGWGWADDSYGGFAKPIYFAASGPQTIRVQVREDGLSLDQIVLGAMTYAAAAPGATKNDTTVVPK
jgi:Putative Ig domain